ncbi:hypothetical protein C8F04DRAFT_1177553 [Mycena alexandri]|uniref:Uncharacterized protein n=1 Tax=Mycena alexandri TaxID=1745969 RepID=A0AAD6TBL1_9AGAR|nr:hypothetical protein C8F04DRAFT_1177553 [Mycena alexandri]
MSTRRRLRTNARISWTTGMIRGMRAVPLSRRGEREGAAVAARESVETRVRIAPAKKAYRAAMRGGEDDEVARLQKKVSELTIECAVAKQVEQRIASDMEKLREHSTGEMARLRKEAAKELALLREANAKEFRAESEEHKKLIESCGALRSDYDWISQRCRMLEGDERKAREALGKVTEERDALVAKVQRYEAQANAGGDRRKRVRSQSPEYNSPGSARTPMARGPGPQAVQVRPPGAVNRKQVGYLTKGSSSYVQYQTFRSYRGVRGALPRIYGGTNGGYLEDVRSEREGKSYK